VRVKAFLLTCEVNDKPWAGAVPDGGFGSRGQSTAKLEVDWVRVWQKGRRAEVSGGQSARVI
jgi:hypothetical protein